MTLEIDKIKNGFKYFISDENSLDIRESHRRWRLVASSKYEFRIWMDLRGLKLGEILVKDIGYTLFQLEKNDDEQ